MGCLLKAVNPNKSCYEYLILFRHYIKKKKTISLLLGNNFHNSTLIPRLKQSMRLKKVHDYVILHGSHPSHLKIIHPSDAFLLILCTGTHSLADIHYLFSNTYNLSAKKASDIISSTISQLRNFLDVLDKPLNNISPCYNAKDYIYNCDKTGWWDTDRLRLPVPTGINLNLSFLCNFKCQYCYQNTYKQKKDNEKLDMQKCISIVREAADCGVIFVGMSGGEPTLFKGWMKILEAILSLGMVPVITSNGSVIGSDLSIAGKLRKIGLEEIAISLDASNDDLHRAMTNSHDSFSKVINGIRSLIDEGIHVSIKNVLTPLNVDNLENFIDFAAGMGVREIGITSMEEGAIGSGANQLRKITLEQYKNAQSIAEEKALQYQGQCNIYPPKNPYRLMNKSNTYPCGGLFMGISIFPSGIILGQNWTRG